jgi:putative membrane protein
MLQHNCEVLTVPFSLPFVLFRNVLPWCLANTALAAAIHYYGDEYANFITASDKGHMFMSLSVSYLLVTRTNICLNRYMAQRSGLNDVVRSCKELVGHAVTYTRMKHKTEDDKRWRRSIAKRTISLLKTIVAVMKYPSSKKHVWEMDDIGEEDKLAAKIAVGKSNERSPLVLVLFLRSVVCSHIHKLSQPLEVQQELQLMQNTTDIMSAYSEVMKYLTTPYPFPLVQMTRTILFVYIFTLPLALSSDIQEVVPFLLTIFFITYGFIGLELIAIEIDDPFGTDPNDFNVGNIAKVRRIGV